MILRIGMKQRDYFLYKLLGVQRTSRLEQRAAASNSGSILFIESSSEFASNSNCAPRILERNAVFRYLGFQSVVCTYVLEVVVVGSQSRKNVAVGWSSCLGARRLSS